MAEAALMRKNREHDRSMEFDEQFCLGDRGRPFVGSLLAQQSVRSGYGNRVDPVHDKQSRKAAIEIDLMVMQAPVRAGERNREPCLPP
jgi:hypothetical protein